MRSAMAALFLVLFAGSAHAVPASWSFERASFGVDAAGQQWTEGDIRASSFLPGAYLSYDLTQGLSIAATGERDFARHLTLGKVGGRFKIIETERGVVALGANLVGYGDRPDFLGIAKPTSWETMAAGAYSVAETAGRTVLWGVAQAGWDEQNGVKWVKVGLRAQVVGGRPY
jgi:hypothetical protein